jgi:VCBS repeat protein
MAINVSGANPTLVTAASDTTTTNTTFNTNPPNDRNYVFADTIGATINAGVVVSGFGLRLESTAADANVFLGGEGSVAINQATAAVELVGNGGTVSYAGTGSITNDDGPGVTITNNGGSGAVLLRNNVFSNNAVGVTIAATGPVFFTQEAGHTVSNSSTSASNAVTLQGLGGSDIFANVSGTLSGAGIALEADTPGDMRINLLGTGTATSTSSSAIDAVAGGSIIFTASGGVNADGDGIVLQTNGSRLLSVNLTGGISAGSVGLRTIASGTGDTSINMTAGLILADGHGVQSSVIAGDVIINMTGGQLGTATDRIGTNGIFALSDGGSISITSRDIFAIDRGIEASLAPFSGINGDINIVVNGIIDAMNVGVLTANFGTGTTSITVNNTITSDVGVDQQAGNATVVNNSTITGTSGIAVFLGNGNDTYDGRGGFVVGAVQGDNGDDTFFSGAGNETFNGGADTDTVDYQGATSAVIVSLAAGTATGHGNDTLFNIENALGTGFDDIFTGDSLANRFEGRAGNDTYVISPGGADIIDGFVAGAGSDDRLDSSGFPHLSSLEELLTLATQVGPNTVIDFGSGDTLTLTNVTLTDLHDDDLILVPEVPNALWRHDDGRVRTSQNDLGAAGNFEVVGTADFDGDGDSDVLFRHADGHNVIWEIENETLVTNHNLPDAAPAWEVAGTGDFDGDGDGDILWRNDTAVVTWEIDDNGFVTHHNLPEVAANFAVAATGDFDADGDDDILWRHDDLVVIWEMQDGALVTNHNLPSVPPSWAVAAAGDFDGDGDDDIVWRNDVSTTIWEIQDNAFVTNHNQPDVPANWHIEEAQDLDQDGDDDIIWHNTDNQYVGWTMEGGNLFDTESFGTAPPTWEIQGAGTFV